VRLHACSTHRVDYDEGYSYWHKLSNEGYKWETQEAPGQQGAMAGDAGGGGGVDQGGAAAASAEQGAGPSGGVVPELLRGCIPVSLVPPRPFRLPRELPQGCPGWAFTQAAQLLLGVLQVRICLVSCSELLE
jgi:hypothetical protein